MPTHAEIRENLFDAGCTDDEVNAIITCIQNGEDRRAEKLIARCRKRQLERVHESQQCIDRLDYLSYRLRNS